MSSKLDAQWAQHWKMVKINDTHILDIHTFCSISLSFILLTMLWKKLVITLMLKSGFRKLIFLKRILAYMKVFSVEDIFLFVILLNLLLGMASWNWFICNIHVHLHLPIKIWKKSPLLEVFKTMVLNLLITRYRFHIWRLLTYTLYSWLEYRKIERNLYNVCQYIISSIRLFFQFFWLLF